MELAAFRTKSRVAILTVALMGVFLLESAAVEAHTFTAPSRVSIQFDDGKFKGRVRSPRSQCIENRRVKVFKVRVNRPDRRIGRDRTNSQGRYSIPKPRGIKGRFYAQVTRRTRGDYPHKHRCRAASSRLIQAP
ncbi:MAG: hypothetical protein M3454_17220 [Actinomycetota bacterium]|nr:hypothetical protein [Actinomycetota bacterium]